MMAVKILLSEDGEEVPQQRICIYGNAGEGKSSAAFSVIQLEDYNVVIYCPEATSLTALQNAMDIYGIDKLEEGKLTLVIPEKGSFKSKELMMSAADETSYNKLHEVFFQGKGIDAATGKKVTLKKLWEYPKDTIIIYDGWSAIMESIGFKAQAEWDRDNGKDKRNMYQIGQNLVAKFFNIMDTAKGHFILTAHSMVADDIAQGKFKGLKTINPNFYTKSLCVPVCGKFTTVFYAKRDSLSNRFTLSLAETSAFTRDSINRLAFKEVADEFNKNLKQNEKITLSSLPTDLTSEVYNFFNNNSED